MSGKVREQDRSASALRQLADVPSGAESLDDVELASEWTFYYDESPPKGISREAFEHTMRDVGRFRNIQDLHRVLGAVDIGKLPLHSNLRLFKQGIKPLWEDPANIGGGKWVIAPPKELTLRLWSEVVVAVIGEQLDHSADVCGVVLSIRPKQDTINIWNRTAIPERTREVSEQLWAMLEPDEAVSIEFLKHKGSLDFNKNFRAHHTRRSGHRSGRGSRSGRGFRSDRPSSRTSDTRDEPPSMDRDPYRPEPPPSPCRDDPARPQLSMEDEVPLGHLTLHDSEEEGKEEDSKQEEEGKEETSTTKTESGTAPPSSSLSKAAMYVSVPVAAAVASAAFLYTRS